MGAEPHRARLHHAVLHRVTGQVDPVAGGPATQLQDQPSNSHPALTARPNTMLSTISNEATVHPMRHALAARRRPAPKGSRAVGFTPAA